MNVLEKLQPTQAERDSVNDAVAALTKAMADAIGDAAVMPSIQGSIAKDTWIRGSTDLDLFILFPLDTSEEDMARITKKAAKAVLDDPREKYAQHPYVVGRFAGFDVDAVPAYAVSDPSQKMSAVDRTPFHTAWVKERIGTLRDDVRLLKQWMKGIGAYGAETSIGGFSGYLVEVITIRAGGFDAAVDWFARGAPSTNWASHGEELVIEDPIDATRNCAAAVTPDRLARAIEAAGAYQSEPNEAFFFPKPPRVESPQVLHAQLEGAQWIGWEFPKAAERLDIVFPQFQKVLGRMRDELERAGFVPQRTHAWTDDTRVGLQWTFGAEQLPESRIHQGPLADQEPNASGFRKKWEGHPDAMGELTVVGGRLQVEVAIRERDVAVAFRRLAATLPLGKHVERARISATISLDPADVDSPWAPIVSEFILDRRPWQR